MKNKFVSSFQTESRRNISERIFFPQRIIEQRPTVLHIVESEVFNEGVQYSDCFSLTLRYCLFRISANQTRFRVTAQVSFIKSLNSVIKSLFDDRKRISTNFDAFSFLRNHWAQRLFSVERWPQGFRLISNREANNFCWLSSFLLVLDSRLKVLTQSRPTTSGKIENPNHRQIFDVVRSFFFLFFFIDDDRR